MIHTSLKNTHPITKRSIAQQKPTISNSYDRFIYSFCIYVQPKQLKMKFTESSECSLGLCITDSCMYKIHSRSRSFDSQWYWESVAVLIYCESSMYSDIYCSMLRRMGAFQTNLLAEPCSFTPKWDCLQIRWCDDTNRKRYVLPTRFQIWIFQSCILPNTISVDIMR